MDTRDQLDQAIAEAKRRSTGRITIFLTPDDWSRLSFRGLDQPDPLEDHKYAGLPAYRMIPKPGSARSQLNYFVEDKAEAQILIIDPDHR